MYFWEFDYSLYLYILFIISLVTMDETVMDVFNKFINDNKRIDRFREDDGIMK